MSQQGKKNEGGVNIETPAGSSPVAGVTLIDGFETKEEEGADRGNWNSKLEFMLTCIGFAVGLGNVWRFPYLCYSNGGGAFLIPYILMLIFIGIPVFFMEMAFGQFTSLGPISAWTVNVLHKGVGWAAVIVATYIVIYYNVIVAWCIYYLLASITTELPWIDCNNWWNTDDCYDGTSNRTDNITVPKTPSEEYYYNNVLRMSDGIHDMGSMVWQLALCLLLAWITIFFVIINGVSSLGKASYFVSLFPYLILTILLIKGCTLPGAVMGIEYYLIPDWSKLTELSVWADAATQIFYSLGCCMCSLIGMASFNNFNNKINYDSLIVPIINCCTSIYAGFVIFTVLGYMADYKDVPMDEVATDGPGLVFVVYPEALATMAGAPFWSFLFFFMMTTLGFSSQFSTVETICTAVMDEYPDLLRGGNRPTLVRILFCTCCFLLGLPQVTEGGFYLFTIMDNYSASYTLLVIGFLEVASIMWIYGYSRFAEDISMMVGVRPALFFRVCWCCLTPLIVFIVLTGKAVEEDGLTLDDYVFPDWSMAIAWLIVAFPLVVIVVYYLGKYLYDGGWALLVKHSQPLPEWGPANPENRTGRYAVLDAERARTEEASPSSPGISSYKSVSMMLTTMERMPSSDPPSYSSSKPSSSSSSSADSATGGVANTGYHSSEETGL